MECHQRKYLETGKGESELLRYQLNKLVSSIPWEIYSIFSLLEFAEMNFLYFIDKCYNFKNNDICIPEIRPFR